MKTSCFRDRQNLYWQFLFFFAIALNALSCEEDTISPLSKSSVTGKVMESASSFPISNVSITTSPPSSAVLTDSVGVFVIDNIDIGDHVITADKPGYGSQTVNVSIEKNASTEITILMSPKGSVGDEIFNSTFPQHQATEQPISVNLSWSVSSQKDGLKYDVLLYEPNSLEERVVASNITDTTTFVEGLQYNSSYFWQVMVKDGGEVIPGELWSFETKKPSNNLFLFAREMDGNFDIYSSDLLSPELFRLTQNPNRDWYPLISPRRDAIAYVSNQEIDPHIYIMNLDGSEKKPITTLPVTGFHNAGIGFCWSPDAGSLLYSHYDNLYRIDNDGSNLNLLSKAPSGRHYRECDWTSQGDKIVALAIGEKPYDSELYLMDSDGANRQLIRPNRPGSMGHPSFSIDGKRIMFTQDISGFESDIGRQLDAHIFMMNFSGSGLIDVSEQKPEGTNDLQPRFSTNGAKIIFINVSNDGLNPPELWMMDTDGNNREKLFSNALMPG